MGGNPQQYLNPFSNTCPIFSFTILPDMESLRTLWEEQVPFLHAICGELRRKTISKEPSLGKKPIVLVVRHCAELDPLRVLLSA